MDALLNLPSHLRARLAGALESGLLSSSTSAGALQSVLGIASDSKDVADALAALEQLGITGRAAIALGVLLLAAWAAWVPARLAPARAQRQYRQAMAAPTFEQAEVHVLRGLQIDPRMHDLRSRYVGDLLDHGRPAEALEQLELVRRRLNSNELFLHEARAWDMLGQPERAEEARRRLHERFWRYRLLVDGDD